MLDKVLRKLPMLILQTFALQGIFGMVHLVYPKVTQNIPEYIIYAPSIVFVTGLHIISIWILIYWYFFKNRTKKTK
jgi:hypothetical protein